MDRNKIEIKNSCASPGVEMDGNGWKWMEMDGNGWIDEMVRNKIEIKNS